MVALNLGDIYPTSHRAYARFLLVGGVNTVASNNVFNIVGRVRSPQTVSQNAPDNVLPFMGFTLTKSRTVRHRATSLHNRARIDVRR